MPAIKTRIDTRSDEFRSNAAHLQGQVDDLRAKAAQIALGGDEGEAVAIAAGAWLAGRRTVVMCQNSGLGNAVNPLTSLNASFAIPTLFITTWRGQPGVADEPQHELMGRITQDLLALIEVEQAPFPNTPDAVAPVLEQAVARMDQTDRPFALVMRKGDVADAPLDPPARAPLTPGRRIDLASLGPPPARAAILARFLELTDEETAVVATTGKCGRELFTLADRRQHLYQVGSMGGASGMALGVALNTHRRVVVLDGDGAALMKLGTFATNRRLSAGQPVAHLAGQRRPRLHRWSGDRLRQRGLRRRGLACGYRFAAACASVEGFASAFEAAREVAGPALIHVRIAPGSMETLGRPTVKPREVARRFKAFLADGGRVGASAALETVQ